MWAIGAKNVGVSSAFGFEDVWASSSQSSERIPADASEMLGEGGGFESWFDMVTTFLKPLRDFVLCKLEMLLFLERSLLKFPVVRGIRV